MKERGRFKASSSDNCVKETSPPLARSEYGGGWCPNAEDVLTVSTRSQASRGGQWQRNVNEVASPSLGWEDPAQVRRPATVLRAVKRCVDLSLPGKQSCVAAKGRIAGFAIEQTRTSRPRNSQRQHAGEECPEICSRKKKN
nr:hypothetical protein CFP56_01076 [Quercus suber]